MIAGTIGSWCSVPWRPGPIGLLPGRTARSNVDPMGAMAGCFCLWLCGVGCSVVLSAHGCELFGVGGVGRGVRRERAKAAAAERSGPRGAGVSFFLRGGCDANGLIPSRLTRSRRGSKGSCERSGRNVSGMLWAWEAPDELG